jgi:hypothetical protein
MTQKNNILERIAGYSNEMMVKRCESLLRILTQTKTKTERTKTGENVTQKRKYTYNSEVESSILESYKHYKQLYENEMDKKYTSIELRPYQVDIVNRGVEVLKENRFVYLAMEVRTGKTLTSLSILDKIEAKNVLFITKKKAIGTIYEDYKLLNPSYDLMVINYESMHTIDAQLKWDAVVLDEAHSIGAFPKPSNRALAVKQLVSKQKPYVILLSGTPTPESYCQMFHQVYGIPSSPFSKYVNFYKFAHDYVKISNKKINGMFINDYTNGLPTIMEAMNPYMINFTQQEAGFSVSIKEHILSVKMKESTYALIKRLKKDLVIEGAVHTLLADTPVKLMSKLHQMYSGTVKFEDGESMIIDTTKAEFIKERFAGQKIGIFYKFKEEFNALKKVFGDSLTETLEEFNGTDKHIALQIVSGREGISLRNAQSLVYFNIDFSATSYWQSRDRMTTKDRTENNVFWVFSEDGIEHEIYKAVVKKKDYTLAHFKKDFYDRL